MSGYVALCLPSPRVVVTWFVTGFTNLQFEIESGGAESPWTSKPMVPERMDGPARPQRQRVDGRQPAAHPAAAV